MPNPTDIARAQAWALAYPPKPYVWGGCSAAGCDCSGMLSALINVLFGRFPWTRLFATGNLPERAAGLGLQTGMGGAGDLNIGVMYPWESSSDIGHTAATLAGLNVESRGGMGALVGDAARGATSPLFGHHWHLPISSAMEGWWQVSIPATELAKIQGAAEAALKGSAGTALYDLITRRVVYALLTGDLRPWNNPADPNATPEAKANWGFYPEARANSLDALGRRIGLVDLSSVGPVVKEAVGQALAASPVQVDEADARAIAEQVATITGERLIRPAAPTV